MNPQQARHACSSTTSLQVAAEPEVANDIDLESLRGEDGIYNIENEEQHK